MSRADFINWYVEYCEAEFDIVENPTDEQTEFPVMYTTFEHWNWSDGEMVSEDEEHEIQVTYFTDPMQVVVYVDNVQVYAEPLADYDAMVRDVEWCSFQDFYNWATDKADIVYNDSLRGAEK